MVSIQIDECNKELDNLKCVLEKGKLSGEKYATGLEIEDAFGKLLNARDTLQTEIIRVTDISGKQLVDVTKLDVELRKVGLKTLRRHYIDMRFWRKIRMPDDQEHWWWELDKQLYGIQKRYRSPFRSLAYTALAIFLIVININFIVQTGSTIATWFLNIFSRVNAQQYGLDVITVVAVVAQIAFSGGLAARLTQRMTKLINRFIARSYDVVRPFTLIFVPVSSFFVGTLIFIGIIVAIDRILPVLSDRLRDTVINVEQPLTSTESVLATSALLDPKIDSAVDLTRLGVQNQDVGNGERAQSLFEQAIGIVPNLIVADYRLANIYVDDAALLKKGIQLLDHSIQALDHYWNIVGQEMTPEQRQQKQDELLHELRLTDESYIYRFNVLLLITRARAFMNLGEPAGALIDLNDAEQIVNEHPELFDIPQLAGSDAAEEATPEAPTQQVLEPLRVPELYYLTAKAYDQRYASTQSVTYQTRAKKYWRLLIQAAERRIGSERLWALEAHDRIPD